MKWYLHYTALPEGKRMVIGPYTEDEVLRLKLEWNSSRSVRDVCVSDKSTPEQS